MRTINQVALSTALSLIVALGAVLAWERSSAPPLTPELRAIVHQICPAGGQPLQPVDYVSEFGIWFSSEMIKSKTFAHIYFCATGMWK